MMMRIESYLKRLTLGVSLVSFAGVLAIMVLNVGDVLATKFFTKPITGTYEITEVLLLLTVMASFAYAQSQKAHINMGLIIKRFPTSVGLIVYAIMGVLSAATAGAVGYAAVLQAQSAMQRNMVTSVLEIPMYPFYYVEAIAMSLFALVLLYDAVFAVAAVRNKKYAEMVISTLA